MGPSWRVVEEDLVETGDGVFCKGLNLVPPLMKLGGLVSFGWLCVKRKWCG